MTWPITGKSGLIIGLGCGLIFGPAQNAATSGVKSHEAGVASAMVNAQQIGGSIGTAVFSSLAAMDWSAVCVDSTVVRAHQYAASARKRGTLGGRTGMKVHLAKTPWISRPPGRSDDPVAD